MATIVDFRNRVKAALGVAGASSERGYEDANLDQHIAQAVAEFSSYLPVEAGADLVVTPGSRSLGLVGLTRLLRVVAVELPTGQWPRALVDYDQWGSALTLAIAPPAVATTARVYYEQAHLVDASGSTILPEHEYVIVEGGIAFAVLARAVGAANTLDVTTQQVQTYQHLRIAQERLAAWRGHLRRVGGRAVRRRLYAPSARPVQLNVVE